MQSGSAGKITSNILNFFTMEHFDKEEHEANWHTPHHLFAEQRAERARRIREIVTREELSELEPGQAPIYTHYVSLPELLHNFWF
jgi:hypothetical protein